MAGQEEKLQPATTSDLRHQFSCFIGKPQVENGQIEVSHPRDFDCFLQGACFGESPNSSSMSQTIMRIGATSSTTED
ncbi:hypothetical protein BSZ22_09135 [Bradyrhizobium canariense]|uniref:Uncharacterized protein n=1 Tax=Bradyrhizobium canariense TaxID=255045 RepID=A0A1X3HB72_9BRAD|nr:hypothetical protein BSZ22_09135 [Bradyrhizobium canariense]OSI80683.1 hypothetical protein BSZ23_10310 [Bradyrhizobium canariense]OSI94133.1 hypothetical protein BSZ25_07780 [Bradyrhizobium canariense]OSI94592.1 hypothetical protein BSZ24_09655 [Bradyrhizobium canariense]OSI97688.1 hypothetical protein BSZ16_39510 [Bradyrhizobium canariense]